MDELLRRSSVLVLRPSGDSLGTGTGFFVAPDTILTNAHVVADAAEVYVTNELIAAPLAGQVIARTPPEAEAPARRRTSRWCGSRRRSRRRCR